jgi:hypothetical protein
MINNYPSLEPKWAEISLKDMRVVSGFVMRRWYDGKLFDESYNGLVWVSSLFVDFNSIKSGDVFTVYGRRFRAIERDILMDAWLCSADMALSRLIVIQYKVSQLLRDIKARLVVTAYVWGLAEVNYDKIPKWRDIYAIDWLYRKVKRTTP